MAIRIAVMGDIENTLDICRLIITKLGKKFRVLAFDGTEEKALLRSIFGRDHVDDAEVAVRESTNVCYTNDMRCLIEKSRENDSDYILCFYNSDSRCLQTAINDMDGIFLCYGAGRLSFDTACKCGGYIKRGNKQCTLLSRKKGRDRTDELLTHYVDVNKVFYIPKSIEDYTVLDSVDNGGSNLDGISAAMCRILDYVGAHYTPFLN